MTQAPETQTEVTALCTSCHLNAGYSITASVHGNLVLESDTLLAATFGQPSCLDCHQSHSVAAVAGIDPSMCTTCHEEAVSEYDHSVHGKGLISGEADVATCGDCHGSLHTMVPATGPESPLYPLNLPQTCAQCHADDDLAARHGIEVENAYQLYMDSIHGHALWESGLLVAAGCSECHGDHNILAKEDIDSSVNRENIPRTCGTCHAGILVDYNLSIHGTELASGNRHVPVCTDCHSAHEITEVDTESSQLNSVGECGGCHAESLETFQDTFHGQVTSLGFTPAAQCSDCHGSHNILPQSDPNSSISEVHLIETCRQCHEKANENFVKYNPHANAEDREAFPVLFWVTRFMQYLIIGVFAFFGFHTLMWFLRSIQIKRRGERLGN